MEKVWKNVKNYENIPETFIINEPKENSSGLSSEMSEFSIGKVYISFDIRAEVGGLFRLHEYDFFFNLKFVSAFPRFPQK